MMLGRAVTCHLHLMHPHQRMVYPPGHTRGIIICAAPRR